jgi:hypothetical protein
MNIPIASPPKPTKSEQQLHFLLNELTQSTDMFLNANDLPKFGLLKNRLNTRYFIYENNISFLDDTDFFDKLTSYGFTYLQTVFTNTTIKKAISILKGDPNLWYPDNLNDNLPIRISRDLFGNITYFNHPSYGTNLSSNLVSNAYIYNSNSALWSNEPHSYKFNTLPQELNENTAPSINNLLSLLKKLPFSQNDKTILLSWLINTVISENNILLELVGTDEINTEETQKIIKNLIDPSISPLKDFPRKPDEINQDALEEYLLSYQNIEQLNPKQETRIYEILSVSGSLTQFGKSKQNKFSISRPILISANESQIRSQRLRNKTVTLEVLHTKVDKLTEYEKQPFNSAHNELIEISSFIHWALDRYSPLPKPTLSDNSFPQLEKFIQIGLTLDKLYPQSTSFYESFKKWSIESQFHHLEDNDSAFLLYKWSENNLNQSKSYSLKDWKNELEELAKETDIDWINKSERKIGSEFKQAQPVLSKLGIKCESEGKTSRFVKWTVNTPETLLNQTPYKFEFKQGYEQGL